MPKKIIAIHVAIEVMVAGQRLDTAGFAGVGETNAIPPVPVRGWILDREGKEPPPTGVGDRSLDHKDRTRLALDRNLENLEDLQDLLGASSSPRHLW